MGLPDDHDASASEHNVQHTELGETSTSQKLAFPTTLKDLTFSSFYDPASNGNIYKTLSALRKSTLSIPNRLLSVLQDADFVEALYRYLNDHVDSGQLSGRQVRSSDTENRVAANDRSRHESQTWPLIPNERSGSWPLSPQLKVNSQIPYLHYSKDDSQPSPTSAYFKSTDGHVNQWAFSPRRLNLPVLELLGCAGCAIVVDTTRRGKTFPDALRRTIPIFTAVWNKTLFDELESSGVTGFQAFGLEKSEVSQIERRLPGFVSDLKRLGLPLEELKTKLKRPIRCIWTVQPASCRDWDASLEHLVNQIEAERQRWNDVGGVKILVCCSASRQVRGAEMSEEGYIQGAGDDSEGWSQGLTANIFWDHKDELMRAIEIGEDIDELVGDLVRRERDLKKVQEAILVRPTKNLYLSAGTGDILGFDLVIDCNSIDDPEKPGNLGLGCKDGKLGSKMLRHQLPMVKDAVQTLLRNSPDSRILVVCSNGRDLSVGVVLTILCSFYDDKGNVQLRSDWSIDKHSIKQRLALITTSKPDANPSRATLQAVNFVLIDRP